MATLKLYWDSVQGAVSYNIYWDTSPGVTTSSPNAIVGLKNVSFLHTNLADDTTYYYIVIAVDIDGNKSSPSVEFSGHSSVIIGLLISPTDVSHLVGETQQYTAAVTYSSGLAIDVTTLASWDTSNHGVATINSSGLATTVSIGNVNITATYNAFTGSTPLEVHHTLVSIAISPSSASINVSATQQFTAIGTYNDAATEDLTTQVLWGSSDLSKATISSVGLATGVAHGSPSITAVLNTIHAVPATLNVNAALVSISVTPKNASTSYPNTRQYTATGTYNDSTTADITNSVTWSSSSTGVATINSSTGLASSVSHGTTNISATSGMISDSTSLTITNVLASISVSPTSAEIATPGNTQQYTATAHYNDGYTQTVTSLASWNSSDTNSATINSSGLATAVGTQAPALQPVPNTSNDATGFITGNSSTNLYALYDVLSGSPVFHSPGDGTWTQTSTWPGATGDGTLTNSMWVDSTGRLYVGYANGNGEGALQITTNGGSSWITATINGLTDQYSSVAGFDQTHVYAGVGTSLDMTLYFSGNQGSTWSLVNGHVGDLINRIYCVSATEVYVVTGYSGGGAVWVANDGYNFSRTALASDYSDVNVTAVWGVSGSVYAGMSGGTLIHSTDNGATWTQQTISTTSRIWGIYGTSASDVFVVETTNIWHSIGDGTWVRVNRSTATHTTVAWAADRDNVYVAAANEVIKLNAGFATNITATYNLVTSNTARLITGTA